MKRVFRNAILFSFLAGTLSLTSCGEDKKEKEAEKVNVPMHAEDPVKTDEMHDNGDEMEFKDQKMASVYGHYTHIKTSLVNSDPEQANKGGQMLVEALQSAGGKEKAMTAAQKIAQSKELNQQRTAFTDLSAAMEEMMAGTLSTGAIYKQFCPMAFEGKGGYWLSSSQEIRNPYYGDKMLKCGSVRDTIK